MKKFLCDVAAIAIGVILAELLLARVLAAPGIGAQAGAGGA